ncbi:MAG TPA: ABC transporter permease [Candidatus Acidoferrum sp.]|nr:ABC transporter permease [Candidatus Acidoferrum sp.]
MRRLRAWLSRLGELFSKHGREQELSAEMESHLQMHIEDNLRAGMSAEAARRQALTKLGGVEQTKEAYRDRRGLPMVETFLHDLRFAGRVLRKSPGFTAVSVLSLALGIGATIAIFSVIYAMALRTLPVSQPDQLVEIVRGDEVNLHSYAEWKEFRDRQDIFASVFAYNYFDASFEITNQNQHQEVYGAYISGDYFSTLGVSAVVGRALQSSDDQPGAPPVCVIGYGLWRRLYGQSADILGRPIRVNGNEFQIVGVAPRSFSGVDVGSMPEIFMPLEAERTFRDYHIMYGKQSPSLDNPRATLLCILARLKPGVSVSQASAGLRVLSPEIYAALPPRSSDTNGRAAARQPLVASPSPNGLSNTWLQDMDVTLLLIAMATVALLIACANLGNLLLARAAKRRSEIATRLALGATRSRLVRQLLTESGVLSVIGAAMGLFIARWVTQALLWALSYPGDPILLDLSWDGKLAAFAVCITLACALLFGLAPAVEATRISVYSAMNNGVTTGRPRNRFMNSGLVVVQVALSVALLASAGLLVHTLQALLSNDPGYDPKGVITAEVSLPGAHKNPDYEAMVGEELLTAFRSLPGVTSASYGRSSSKMSLTQLVVPGPGASERRIGAYLGFSSPDSFKTWRTPILAGREFNDTDTATSLPVAVLSAELARVLFGKVNPVALRFRENDGDGEGTDYAVEVVGVVRDIQLRRPGDAPLPALHRPVSQCGSSCSDVAYYQIRVAGALAEATKRVENAAATVDPRIVLKCGRLSDIISDSVHRNRAMALIATAFSLFVGLLAMIGVYGVTSYAASERTREIGIRMALGADRGDVFRMLLGEMTRVVCIGIAFGVGAGIAAAQMIRGTIWGVKATDPLSIGFAIGLMLLIAGIAAFLPARRAMRVDPMVALRYE